MAKKVVIFWDRKREHYYYVNPRNKREKIVSESASLLRNEILNLEDEHGKKNNYKPIFKRDAEIEWRSNHS